jgi:quercetin dioxygenase-like cupin family protein
MTEVFSNQSKSSGLSFSEGDSCWLNHEDLPWQESGSEGFWIKPLFEDKQRSLRTWLMKVDPGAYSPMHAHEELEQVYVIQGSFYDQYRVYQAGEYILRAPGAMHSAGSEEGAMVMLFYSPVNQQSE